MIRDAHKNAIFSACLDIIRQSNLILDDVDKESVPTETIIKEVNEKLILINKSLLKIKILIDKAVD